MTDRIKELVREAIAAKMCAWQKKPDGYYHEEIYADYRDEMDDETATKIIKSNDPHQTFYEKMFEWYQDAEWQIESDIKQYVMEHIEIHAPNEEIDDEEIRDEIRELVSIDYPYEHFLDQELYVNIMVDTGDGNYDYVLNCVYPHYNGVYGETINDKASIVWLARQQGYTKRDLNAALRLGDVKNPNGFLQSMRQEVINGSSHMLTLTFLAKMTLRDLIELNEAIKLQDKDKPHYDATERPYCGFVIIDKKAETGLYDPWNGGGSVFEIQLEKDVRLPIRFIRSALPDGGDGYSVEGVYGMCGSAWRDVIKKIHKPCKAKEEAE